MIETAAEDRDAAGFGDLGYCVIRRLLDPALVDFLWSFAHTKFASRLMVVGITQMRTSPACYGDPTFGGLLEYVRPQVERAVGLRLLPTYSFFRLHNRGDVLTPHTDRRANEIVVTTNIGQIPAEPWPFCIEGAGGPARVELRPGDAMAYRGHQLSHWRDPFPGDCAVQAIFSYVDADGPYRALKFDRRPSLMRPFSERQPD